MMILDIWVRYYLFRTLRMVSKTKPNRASKASKVGHDEIVVALRGGVSLDTSNLNCLRIGERIVNEFMTKIKKWTRKIRRQKKNLEKGTVTKKKVRNTCFKKADQISFFPN